MAGANVSDQETAWTHNYRCPDVVVVLPGSKAVDRDTHWFGGPDFLVEIASEGDASREKLAFYGDIGVREAMIVDRDPWSLVLYRLDSAGRMATVGSVSLSSSGSVASAVLGVEMKLVLRDSRPSIEIQHLTTGRIWRT
jgi:Uma2 family endonuclease